MIRIVTLKDEIGKAFPIIQAPTLPLVRICAQGLGLRLKVRGAGRGELGEGFGLDWGRVVGVSYLSKGVSGNSDAFVWMHVLEKHPEPEALLGSLPGSKRMWLCISFLGQCWVLIMGHR